MIQCASGRRLWQPSCSGLTPHILRPLVQRSCGQYICSLETSQTMCDVSQIQAQQSTLPTFQRFLTHFKINLRLFMKNGTPNKRISSHIAGENSYMAFGNSYSMTTSSMHTNMGLWCKARIR